MSDTNFFSFIAQSSKGAHDIKKVSFFWLQTSLKFHTCTQTTRPTANVVIGIEILVFVIEPSLLLEEFCNRKLQGLNYDSKINLAPLFLLISYFV